MSWATALSEQPVCSENIEQPEWRQGLCLHMHERLDRRRLLRGAQPAASINHFSTSCPSAATAKAAQSESSKSSAITVSIPWTANAPNQDRNDSS